MKQLLRRAAPCHEGWQRHVPRQKGLWVLHIPTFPPPSFKPELVSENCCHLWGWSVSHSPFLKLWPGCRCWRVQWVLLWCGSTARPSSGCRKGQSEPGAPLPPSATALPLPPCREDPAPASVLGNSEPQTSSGRSQEGQRDWPDRKPGNWL